MNKLGHKIDVPNYVWARIDRDGTQWLNLEGRGWTRVTEILLKLDEALKPTAAIIWAVSMSAAALTGVLGLLVLRLFG
jgi:hypothetical protein